CLASPAAAVCRTTSLLFSPSPRPPASQEIKPTAAGRVSSVAHLTLTLTSRQSELAAVVVVLEHHLRCGPLDFMDIMKCFPVSAAG
ncbi:uncharacterized protein PgNI_04485, partial [Pyricularia grisea]|uniref:Uncharacterized protein n=1 Tax=Pyricularia grisea TaxID=148305 RepID=A0A6P8BA78_PYRGI